MLVTPLFWAVGFSSLRTGGGPATVAPEVAGAVSCGVGVVREILGEFWDVLGWAGGIGDASDNFGELSDAPDNLLGAVGGSGDVGDASESFVKVFGGFDAVAFDGGTGALRTFAGDGVLRSPLEPDVSDVTAELDSVMTEIQA